MQAKRFETLWRRISKELPWVEEKGVSSHWIRHTTVTWIDRAFNSTMAQAFAGHTPANVTASYSTPTPEELAQAHAALTGTSQIEPIG
jgi:integrase/recombinase XerC